MANIAQSSKCASEVIDHVKKLLEPGKSPKDVAQFYDEWAESYDNDLSVLDYNLPKLAALELSNLLDGKEDSRILDCGAGTGLVGQELARLGFSNIDALDPSPAMLEKGKTKGVYTNLICDFLGTNRLNITSGVYDAVLLVGCLCEGHVTPDCFDELCRITKSGGNILMTAPVDYINGSSALKDNFETSMKKIEENGRWKLIMRKFAPKYSMGMDYLIIHLQVC